MRSRAQLARPGLRINDYDSIGADDECAVAIYAVLARIAAYTPGATGTMSAVEGLGWPIGAEFAQTMTPM